MGYRGTIKYTAGNMDFSADNYKDITIAWSEGWWEIIYWDPEDESLLEKVAFA